MKVRDNISGDILCRALTFILTLFLSSVSHAGLEGSKHDLRIPGAPEPACIFCHLPHKEAEEPPLWDKETKKRSWPLKVLKKEKVSAAKLCLSCHDGNIAQDVTAFIPSEELRKERYIMKKSLHITHIYYEDIEDIEMDHPVGIRYKNLARHNPGLRQEPLGDLKLKKGRIDCTTCHSVHNETPFKGMLVIDNYSAGLCLGCHIK